MKRAISALLAALMLLTLTACGGNGKKQDAGESTATVSGYVNCLDDYLVLLTDDEEYAVFDFGEDVDPAALEEGDRVTVTYTGELGSEDSTPVAVAIEKAES